MRFADATSQAPLTGPAHAALLTGQYPARLGVRDNATTPIPAGTKTLAQAFKDKGYRTGGFVGAFILGTEYGFGQGFDVFDATFARFSPATSCRRNAAEARSSTRPSSGCEAVSGQPTFTWIHLYDAHAPYDAPAPFARGSPASPYDGEIAYVDSCIARIVSALERNPARSIAP